MHDASLRQNIEIKLAQAQQAAENLLVMFAQNRNPAADARFGFAHPQRRIGNRKSARRVLDLDRTLPELRLRPGQRLGDGAQPRHRAAAVADNPFALLGGVGLRP